MLHASRQVDLFDVETGRPYEAGIPMLAAPGAHRRPRPRGARGGRAVIEAGGVARGGAGAPRAPRRGERARRGERLGRARGGAAAGRGQARGRRRRRPLDPVRRDRRARRGVPGPGRPAPRRARRPARRLRGLQLRHASIMYNVVERLPGVARLVQVGIRDISEEEHGLRRGVRGARGGRTTTPRLGAGALRGRALGGAGAAHRRAAPARRLPLVRHRRARPVALPAHRHAGARRPLLPAGLRARRRRRAERAAHRRAST